MTALKGPSLAAEAARIGAEVPVAGGPPAPGLPALEWAIVQAVAYADVFDYPLTPQEVQRYLVGVTASQAQVEAALAPGSFLGGVLGRRAGYVCLPGREASVEMRQRRAETAARCWPVAVRYGRLLARLPFVRMVAVTGALAVDNVEPGCDIDYLIVTEPGRLWLCRGLVIGLVRLAARRGHEICPNYFLSERALSLAEQTLYTAHELLQMVPLAGLPVYRQLRRLNQWADGFLPNAAEPRLPAALGRQQLRAGSRWAEPLLRTPPGGWVERWEMRRKIRKLGRQGRGNLEASFSPEWCKGHFQGYGQRTLAAFEARLGALGLESGGAA
jgi:hypothetical protein